MPPRRLPDFDRGAPSTLTVGGETIRAFERESVAVALFASGASVLSRSLKYHRPRSFFCLEGHCGGCLMRIGGLPNQRACMEPCGDGAQVAGQNAYPSPDMDVLAAVDWMFPDGMNHHTLMTGSRLLNKVANKVVRQLSGLGLLPATPSFTADDAEAIEPDVLVVGGGAAGLAAAAAAAAAGARVLLCDEQDAPGGSLLADPRFGPADAAARAAAAARAGVRIESRATAIGYFPEDDGGLVAVATPRRLLLVRARAVVYATGGYAQNRPFGNNDRPGVVAARAVGRLLVRYGVVPAERIVLVGGDGPPDAAGRISAEAEHTAALARALGTAGCDVTVVDPRHQRLVGARGRAGVRALVVADAAGNERSIPCDLIAVAAPPAPASEAARQHGCQVELRPRAGGFAVVVDGDGRTSVPGVFACGDVCGATTPQAAAEAGARAGRAAAQVRA